jgi:hypothetical protein
MVARQCRPSEFHQPVTGFGWPQGAGEAIAEVDDLIDMAAGDVGQHGFQRRQIAMNVRNGGDPHRYVFQAALFVHCDSASRTSGIENAARTV